MYNQFISKIFSVLFSKYTYYSSSLLGKYEARQTWFIHQDSRSFIPSIIFCNRNTIPLRLRSDSSFIYNTTYTCKKWKKKRTKGRMIESRKENIAFCANQTMDESINITRNNKPAASNGIHAGHTLSFVMLLFFLPFRNNFLHNPRTFLFLLGTIGRELVTASYPECILPFVN